METSASIGVGELARQTGTTVRAIRHYEQIGLLTAPAGLALPHCPDGAVREVLWRVQNELFDVGANLARETSAREDTEETVSPDPPIRLV